MNILLDFIPLQHNGGVGGAASFAKTVCDKVVEQRGKDIMLFAAYDSTIPKGRQYDYERLANECNIALLDIAHKRLADIIQDNNIDVFFIAIGQFYASYDLSGVTCKTIMFIHDIFDVERTDNLIDLSIYGKFSGGFKGWLRRAINIFSHRREHQIRQRYSHILPLYAAANTISYTVSEYSAQALHYYFPEIKKEIRICYSPIKQVSMRAEIENEQLKTIIKNGEPYLFMLAANRIYKNPSILLKVFEKLNKEGIALHLVTLKYGKSIHPCHTDIDFLTDSDLEHAYKHAFALVFPSFFEGFGYPPIEAMRYGTPVIASNVTSIPEVAGDAAIYFSPFYPADLYRAIKQLLTNPKTMADKMQTRCQEIATKQEHYMKDLVRQILEPTNKA